MAVNTVDKLQFLSLIFAVLLSVTVHFIEFRLLRAIMHQYNKVLLKSVQILEMSILQMAICHHVVLVTGQNFI